MEPVTHEAGTAQASAEKSCVDKLAQLFPHATPVSMPVHVTALRAGDRSLGENAVIEFGTPTVVLFRSTLPLEFDDRVQLRNLDGSLDEVASVVAVQYQEGQRAVAVRFLGRSG